MVYSYYDTPDGQDCFKKIGFVSKYAAMGAFVISVHDVMMYSHTKGYIQTAVRMGFWAVPAVSMASAFAATTCISTNLRKKDDQYNYLFGGIASGLIFGTACKSMYAGFWGCIFLGGAAVIKKSSKLEGWKFFNFTNHRCVGDISPTRFDFSLTPEGEKGWITGKE